MSVAAPSDHARTAFDAAARIYDDFTAHHDYECWTQLVEELARRHGLPPRGTMLDVGCGTGKSFLPWLDRGWTVVACDASPPMLERAAAKAGDRARVLVEDARALPVLGRFDLVLMLDDVVNYLGPDELAATFAGAAANVAPGGVLVFDLNTLRTFRTFFAATEARDTADGLVVWRGQADERFAPGETAEAVLDGFVAGPRAGTWVRHRGVHREHHHTAETVERHLRDAGLRLAGAYGQDDRGNVHPRPDELRHTKTLLFARHAREMDDSEEVTT